MARRSARPGTRSTDFLTLKCSEDDADGPVDESPKRLLTLRIISEGVGFVRVAFLADDAEEEAPGAPVSLSLSLETRIVAEGQSPSAARVLVASLSVKTRSSVSSRQASHHQTGRLSTTRRRQVTSASPSRNRSVGVSRGSSDARKRTAFSRQSSESKRRVVRLPPSTKVSVATPAVVGSSDASNEAATVRRAFRAASCAARSRRRRSAAAAPLPDATASARAARATSTRRASNCVKAKVPERRWNPASASSASPAPSPARSARGYGPSPATGKMRYRASEWCAAICVSTVSKSSAASASADASRNAMRPVFSARSCSRVNASTARATSPFAFTSAAADAARPKPIVFSTSSA
mmetsp:Transcript_10372/g.31290  ORF Transcript_10372/g.31290 Transcript_10372/m.31290 type:complete len:353 (-) Transcript_10372:1143-2201(-)